MAPGHFLNVDLEVHSREDLSLLAGEFESPGMRPSLPTGGRLEFLAVELEDEPSGTGLEARLVDLCALVETLPRWPGRCGTGRTLGCWMPDSTRFRGARWLSSRCHPPSFNVWPRFEHASR